MNNFIPLVNQHHRIMKSERHLRKLERIRKIKETAYLLLCLATVMGAIGLAVILLP